MMIPEKKRFKVALIAIATCLLVLISSFVGPSNESEKEEEAVNKAVMMAYESLSYTEGTTPNWANLRKAFIEGAVFRSFRTGEMDVFSIENYIENYRKFVEGGSYKAIVEKEIWGETQVFGNVAHRLSTYALYYNDLTKEAELGVNSMQLVKTAEGWKITSVIYDTEKTNQRIPKEFLK